MQLNPSFLALAAMVTSLVGATALPAVEVITCLLLTLTPLSNSTCFQERAEEEAQFDGHLFVCTDLNWSGACLNIGFYSQVCQNFPSGFDNEITSVGPDSGWNCHLLMFVVSPSYWPVHRLTDWISVAITIAILTRAITGSRPLALVFSPTATTRSAHLNATGPKQGEYYVSDRAYTLTDILQCFKAAHKFDTTV